MNFRSALLGSVLTLSAIAAQANTGGESAKDALGKSELNGSVFVTDNRKPLRDVTITAYSASRKEMTATTDGNGNYFFDGLRSGTYRFVFERQGYRKVVKEKVQIRADEGFQLNVGMEEEEEFNWLSGSLQLLGGD